MEQEMVKFALSVDETSAPVMFGIVCTSGHRAERLSADSGRVERLVRACNEGALSVEHFWDVVADFLRDLEGKRDGKGGEKAEKVRIWTCQSSA